MRLSCDACHTPYLGSDIHPALGLATCHQCGAVHRIEVPTPPVARPAAPVSARPERFDVRDDAVGYSATWTWRTPAVWFLIPFTLFWNGFMVVWYSIALTQGEPLMAAFGTVHLAIGLGLAYYVATQLVNRTTIELTVDRLTVAHAPLWWPGARQLERSSISQLYVVEVVRTNKGRHSYTWTLMAVGSDGVGRELVTGLRTLEEGRYLEQTLEKKLGIADRAVDGEA